MEPILPGRLGPLAGAAAALILLSGCSLLGGPWKSHAPAPVAVVKPPPPPPAPALPAPSDNHKFVIIHPDDDVYGEVQITRTSKEDTLSDIARRFNVGYEEIVHANPGVDPWVPGAGRRIVVPTRFVLPDAPRDGIVIDVSALRLYYFPRHKRGEQAVFYTYPIGIGRMGWTTPIGTTRVVGHKKDPTWRPSAALRKEHHDDGDDLARVIPPGPDNPLGKYELLLGWPSYLIHGTNKPYGVGLRSSHGCIHLYPEDIERVFQMVPIGTPVHVVNEPFLFGRHDGRLYLQAYTVLKDDKRPWNQSSHRLLLQSMPASIRQALAQRHESIDWDVVEQVMQQPRGIPVPLSGSGTSVESVLAAARLVQNRIPDGADWDGSDDTGSNAQADAAAHPAGAATAQTPSPRT